MGLPWPDPNDEPTQVSSQTNVKNDEKGQKEMQTRAIIEKESCCMVTVTVFVQDKLSGVNQTILEDLVTRNKEIHEGIASTPKHAFLTLNICFTTVPSSWRHRGCA